MDEAFIPDEYPICMDNDSENLVGVIQLQRQIRDLFVEETYEVGDLVPIYSYSTGNKRELIGFSIQYKRQPEQTYPDSHPVM